jgi:HK97 family phage major capsid protein
METITESEFYERIEKVKSASESLEQFTEQVKGLLAECKVMDGEDEVEFELDGLIEKYKENLNKEKMENKMDNNEIESIVDKAVEKYSTKAIEVIGARNDDKKTFGFKSFGEYAFAVMNSSRGVITETRLEGLVSTKAPSSYNTGQTGNLGGFAIPPDFFDEIINLNSESEDLAAQCNIVRTNSDGIELAVNPTKPWSNDGVTSYWVQEGAQITASTDKVTPRYVKLQTAAAFVNVTNQLMSDAPRMADNITIKAREAVRSLVNNSILNGTGSGQPLGVFNSGAFLEVAKESSGNTGNFIAENATKIFSALHPDYAYDAIWIINQAAYAGLLMLKVGQTPVWASAPVNGGFKGGPEGYLLGKPVYVSKYAKAYGAAGDVSLMNLKQAYNFVVKVGDESGRLDFSPHLYFDYNMSSFRLTFRCAGQPLFEETVTLPSGLVVSPYVTVQAR